MTRVVSVLLFFGIVLFIVYLLRLEPGGAKFDPDDWETIASVDGLDEIGQKAVQRVLAAHQIDCMIEGSVAYGVSVPRSLAKKARTLLETSPELKGVRKRMIKAGKWEDAVSDPSANQEKK